MRAIFVGGVQFSRSLLEAAMRGPLDVVGVCTSSTPSGGDGFDLGPTARDADIPVLDARSLNTPASIAWMSALNPDLIVCVGWSRLLSRAVLEVPPLGVLGYHPAELPRNRGRHPIIWTIALGLDTAGSTFFMMDERADSGPIVSQRSLPVAADETAGSLYRRLNDVAVSQFEQIAVNLELHGRFTATPQDDSLASEWRKRTTDDGRIDWRMPSVGIDRLVRALGDPYPGAHMVVEGREIVIRSSTPEEAPQNIEPGRVMGVDGQRALIKTGDGAVRIHAVESLAGVIRPGDWL